MDIKRKSDYFALNYRSSGKATFTVIWIGLIAIILTLGIIPATINKYYVSIALMFLHAFFIMIFIIKSEKKVNIILVFGFIVRIIFMFWDIYASNIFNFPNSGVDSEVYYYYGAIVSRNLNLIFEPIRGGIYPKLLGILFAFTGVNRMFAQYVNVLFGISTLIILYKIMRYLNLKEKFIKIILLIGAFLPNSLIMSAILLREIIITFFVTTSLYYFIKWFKGGINLNMLLSLIMLIIASSLHSGVIAILIGYSFAMLFINRNTKKLSFSMNSVIIFIILATIMFIVFIYLADIVLYKFQKVDSVDDVYSNANSRYGGSQYLSNLKINNLLQLIIFGPIKALYFLSAPMPWDWRGLMDIISFLLDSILYIGILLYLFRMRKQIHSGKELIIVLILIIISVSLIFGIGVSNAGTAIRHRQKFINIFLVLFAMILNNSYLYKENYTMKRKV